ncbi:MAG: tRNA lysidine(34) synthetase TilS [Chloroflexi bacterium]|nr:tRNA lysidine(34) synthetase TilS [Chloroflexota bacterium]
MNRASPAATLRRRLAREVSRVLQEVDVPGRVLLVAVSGGPDSLCLLHLLDGLKEALKISLAVAHLDHSLRPESPQEAAFVLDAARRLGLEAFVERADVASYRRANRLSLEDAARRLRYDFLARTAHRIGAHAVAVAHTADDQAETVLMNILRGAGLRGLKGMSAVSQYRTGQDRQVTLVRPLLGVRRSDTEEFCRLAGLSPVIDPSNLSLAIVRNRIRWQVLPVLRELNPNVNEALLRLASSAGDDASFIEAAVDQEWRRLARQDEGAITIDRAGLRQIHRSLQRHLLRRAFEVLTGSAEGLELSHMESMACLARGTERYTLDLPCNSIFEAEGPHVVLRHKGPLREQAKVFREQHPIAVPGETALEGWRVRCDLVPPDAAGQSSEYVSYLDYEALDGSLAVRGRRRGDRFQPLGMEQTKRLQDFLVDQKVPASVRDGVPLLVSPRGIAWVVGYRIAHWARIRPETGRVLRVQFTPTL